jgi:hypothetical protein
MLELSALDMPLGGLKLSPPGGVDAVGVGGAGTIADG